MFSASEMRPDTEALATTRSVPEFDARAFLPNPAQSLTVRSVIEACFRNRRLFLWVAGLTIAVTLACIFLLPRQYQANMQLMVLNTRENSIISADGDQLVRPTVEITDNDVNSQAELVHGRDVLNDALDQLGVPRSPDVARDRALYRLSRALDVSPVRQSNILNVSYVDSSPEGAKRVLQAVASSFVEKELSLRRPLRTREIFAQVVDTDRQALNQAEAKLADFKVTTGIASLADDEAALLRQVQGTSDQSAELTAGIAEARRRAGRTLAELANHPIRISTQTRSTPNQKAVEDLTTTLVALENRRTALLDRYQPTEPNVQEIDQQIATVQSEIAQQQRSSAQETTTDINPVAEQLQSSLATAQINEAAFAARREALDAQHTTYMQQLDQLEQKTAAYRQLQKNVAEAQHNYDVAVEKRDQASLDDALDKERILNVAFAAKPSASYIPVRPRPKMYLALGMFSALFLGIGSCMIKDFGRGEVHSPAQLEAISGVMTLASLPLQKPPRDEPRLVAHTGLTHAGEELIALRSQTRSV